MKDVRRGGRESRLNELDREIADGETFSIFRAHDGLCEEVLVVEDGDLLEEFFPLSFERFCGLATFIGFLDRILFKRLDLVLCREFDRLLGLCFRLFGFQTRVGRRIGR